LGSHQNLAHEAAQEGFHMGKAKKGSARRSIRN
jgi:hypothetical protein